MFEKGELVVYGRNGICEVTDITPMKLDGKKEERLYYILIPVKDRSGKIFTPVDNHKVPMRHVISKDEAVRLIDGIAQIAELGIENDKTRELSYKECMKSCQCTEWVRMIKTLRHRRAKRLSEGKKITVTDERYLRQAQDSLYAELSVALGIPECDVEGYIGAHLGEKKE